MSAHEIEREDAIHTLQSLLDSAEDPSIALQRAADWMLRTFALDRCTIRIKAGEDDFPVRYEACAPGVGSLLDDTTDLSQQPVFQRIKRDGEQIVEADYAAAFEGDDTVQALLQRYGGLAAQIITPIHVDGAIRALVSLHQCGAPRAWSVAECELARDAAQRLSALL